jgi:cold shock protein
VPTGKVKWFDVDKGFGFLSQDDGPDVYVHADALPAGTAKTLKAGTRVEFGIAQGRRGEQALQVRIIDAPASVTRNQRAAQRRKPDEMVEIIENVTRMLDDVKAGYERGRPPGDLGKKAARLLRAVADEFEL